MNRRLFDRMYADGALNLARSDLFDTPPPAPARPVPFERVEGMLLGVAVGDALGNTSESLVPDARRIAFGEIRDYPPNRYAEGPLVGLPTDDTQLTFWALDEINRAGFIDLDRIADRFRSQQIFGIGGTVSGWLRNCSRGDRPPIECGVESAGNGALMRITPALVSHLGRPSADLWIDAALLGAMTHNDSASIAGSVAFAGILWELLSMERSPEQEWWLETFLARARSIESHANYTPRGGLYTGFVGTLSDFVYRVVPDAFERGLSTKSACESWYSGAFLLETVPSVLYVLMRHGHDPEEAIVRAVNDTRDNDTIASIVGAAVGALHGKDALPARWLDGLLGRTTTDDDGAVYRILDETKDRWF